MSKIIKFCFLTAALSLVAIPVALAQTVETTDAQPSAELIQEAADEAGVPEEVIIDETVSPEDLGVKEPTLLPDSKFYFLKSWRRGIKSIFTRDPVKKAELKLKYASEKLLEARKLVEKNKRPEILEKALNNFEEEMEKLGNAVNKIKDTANSNSKVGQFLDKFVRQQVLHQKVLDKLGEQVPEGILEKITETRERHLEKFGEVMDKLEDKEQIRARIENSIKTMAGSQFKEIKEMEILERFRDRAPETIKQQITEAVGGIMEKFGKKVEQMPAQTRERFENYAEKIENKVQNQTEILERVRQRIQQEVETEKQTEYQLTLRLIQTINPEKYPLTLPCTVSIFPIKNGKKTNVKLATGEVEQSNTNPQEGIIIFTLPSGSYSYEAICYNFPLEGFGTIDLNSSKEEKVMLDIAPDEEGADESYNIEENENADENNDNNDNKDNPNEVGPGVQQQNEKGNN